MTWVTLVTAPNEPLREPLAPARRRRLRCADTITALIAGGVLTVQAMVREDEVARAQELLEQVVGPWEWPEGAGRR